MAAKAAFTMIGHLYLQSVRPFRTYPLRLAAIPNLFASQAHKRDVARQVYCAKGYCVDPHFTGKFKRRVGNASAANEGEARAELADVFSVVFADNIHIEDKFARIRCHLRSINDNALSVASIASDHLISESRQIFHDRSCLQEERSELASLHDGTTSDIDKTSEWNAFVSLQTRGNRYATLADKTTDYERIAAVYRDANADQRAEYLREYLDGADPQARDGKPCPSLRLTLHGV